MAIIDRHRVARLIELSAAERTLKGPERMLREEDVKLLIKAAYDDATDAARAEFMARVQKMPTSAWPWSAVQAMAPRGGGGGNLGAVASLPHLPMMPALLVLIRGQAESADIDPGNRLPDPGALEAHEWLPLYKALDAWDTQMILKSVGPQGWVSLVGNTSGQAQKDTGAGAPSNGSHEPAEGATNGSPNGGPSEAASGPPVGDKAPGGQTDLPAPQPPLAGSWAHPAVLAAGAAVVIVGGVALYSLGQSRQRSRLEEALGRQEEIP